MTCYDTVWRYASFVMRLKYSNRGTSAAKGVARTVLAVSIVLSATPLRADATDSDLTSAQVAAEILRVQTSADAVARRWADAELRSETLAEETLAANESVAATSVEYNRLESEMTQVAIDRFTGRANETILVLGGNAMESMQRDALRAMTLDLGAADLDSLDAVQTQLASDKAHLEKLNTENAQLVIELADSQASINAQLAQLAQLETHLKDEEVKREYEAQLAAQRQEEKRVAAAQAAALAAQQEQAAATAAAAVRGSGSPSIAATTPVAAGPAPAKTPVTAAPAAVFGDSSWLCPVAGLNAFGDTWGAPRPGGRKHQGVDMMSPSGTPIVAVVAGVIKFSTSERGGNLASLNGVDGHRYFYGHLSAWEGTSRSVAAGEVIGYVGKTGQTNADHLHFEIHPNGGGAVNPYPTVRQAC